MMAPLDTIDVVKGSVGDAFDAQMYRRIRIMASSELLHVSINEAWQLAAYTRKVH